MGNNQESRPREDYRACRAKTSGVSEEQELSDSMQAMKERSDFITNKLNEMMAQRAERLIRNLPSTMKIDTSD